MHFARVLDDYFRHRAAQDLFSGVVLITRGASRSYARAFGYASRAWRVPNTLDTRSDTASITKLFTAIATLQLIDRGLLAFGQRQCRWWEGPTWRARVLFGRALMPAAPTRVGRS